MSVCVVIPVYKERNQLTVYEEISLKQCFKKLSNHTIYFIGPGHLSWKAYLDFSIESGSFTQVKIFAAKYFYDLGGYSRLLLNVDFYQAFASFEYLLLYQTDAFVFYDDLNNWCKKGYDYIGAPWFEEFSSTNRCASFITGGNGGFSLRKVHTHLKVLHSFSYINPPGENWKKRMSGNLTAGKYLKEICGFFLDCTVRNNTYWLLNSFKGFEDQFWCLVAEKNFNWFTIPNYSEAIGFAIEMQPERVFGLNNQRLPFGCHAWWKYDLDFWKPYIRDYGYEL